jgi:hypothetical protein
MAYPMFPLAPVRTTRTGAFHSEDGFAKDINLFDKFLSSIYIKLVY